MKYNQISVLLSCHSLDDFPVYHEGDDAESLLCAWTLLWHPHLIAAAGQMPRWHRTDLPLETDQVQNGLVVVPRPSRQALTDEQLERWRADGAVVIDSPISPDDAVRDALAPLGELPPLSDPWVLEFQALGYAYLQLELLTRQMRYATRISDSTFGDQLVRAAQAAVDGNESTTEEQLQACFDCLSQERSNYYAVDVFLVDLALWAEGIDVNGLKRQLDFHSKTNLLAPAAAWESLERLSPDLFAELVRAVNVGSLAIVGGEYRELATPLFALATERGQLQEGLRRFEGMLGKRPTVFGRRRFGLTPSLPQMLQQFGFDGALHATLDGGHYPQATQTKSRWEGDNQVSIDAISRAPLDASRPETFLKLANSVSESMDTDHVATRCLAHWAGERSRWYDTLLRVTRRTQALGRFVTLPEYFAETYDPGHHDQFTADQYRSPFLAQEVQQHSPQPISACVDYWQHHGLTQAMQALATMRALIDPSETSIQDVQSVAEIAAEFTLHPDDHQRWRESAVAWRERTQACAHDIATKFARTLGPRAATTTSVAIVNPLSFPVRVGLVDQQITQRPPADKPVYAIHEQAQEWQVVVDVPALGVVIAGTKAPSRHRAKATPCMAEEDSLRNEFLEASIDPKTGALRSLRDFGSRGNRLSQQLAMRIGEAIPTEDSPHAGYSFMIADSVQVLRSTPIIGEIVARGRLVDEEDQHIADFSQTYRLLRGSRVLEVTVDLQPKRVPGDDPWRSYYAARFAWSNEAAEVARSFCDSKRTTSASQFEAPLFWETDDGHQRTAVLTGGLTFHRRMGRRMIDTLLIVKGETRRTFRFGLGVDLKQPFREAHAFLVPSLVVEGIPAASETVSSWLFHVDARNVIASHWRPIIEADHVRGVRVHLMETDGRATQVALRCFRDCEKARKVDGLEKTMAHCEIKKDLIRVSMNAREFVELEVLFAS